MVQLLQKVKRDFYQSQIRRMDTHFSIRLDGRYAVLVSEHILHLRKVRWQVTDSLFLFCWHGQEVLVEGQDKVFKDVIEPLESVSVNMIPTGKLDIRDFGSPQEVYLLSHSTSMIKNKNRALSCCLCFVESCNIRNACLMRVLSLIVQWWQVAQILIKKFLAPPNQRTKIVMASEVWCP